MNIPDYFAGQLSLNRGTAMPYTQDYVGAVQMLEKAGFSPFTDTSPLKSTLNQIFDRFVQKTGLDADSNTLQDEFLAQYPSTQRALGLYESLENTFAARRTGEQAAIVDFLNSKIDEYITEKDTNNDNTLTLEESGLTETLFEEADANRDAQLNREEMRSNFYNDFRQLDNVLNYFRTTPGVLIDVYA